MLVRRILTKMTGVLAILYNLLTGPGDVAPVLASIRFVLEFRNDEDDPLELFILLVRNLFPKSDSQVLLSGEPFSLSTIFSQDVLVRCGKFRQVAEEQGLLGEKGSFKLCLFCTSS